MNKTVNINLAGVFFHIDEDAFLKLKGYLDAIKNSFVGVQGQEEIIHDIEARIAELFTEKMENKQQVVGLKEVNEVIEIMGQPEDYKVDDELFEDEEPTSTTYTKTTNRSKKLYRDVDNSYLAGVCSGLGHYLGLEAIWVRLLFILFTIVSSGAFLIVYLIFWIVVPEAITTSEKLEMRGEPINISNIEKKIKEGYDSVADKVKSADYKKYGDQVNRGASSFSRNLSDFLCKILGFIGKIIGIFLIIFAGMGLIGLLFSLLSLGTFGIVDAPWMDYVEMANIGVPFWVGVLLIFLVAAIPLFVLFLLGLKILVKNLKSTSRTFKFSLLGVWLVAIFIISFLGIRQATERAFDGESVTTEQINIYAGDTLNLKMAGNTNYGSEFYRNDDLMIRFDEEENKVLFSTGVRLIVKSTKASTAQLKIVKSAEGKSFKEANQRAEAIKYSYDFTGNTLTLDCYFITGTENMFSDQEIEITLYLPENTVLYANENTYSYHRNTEYYGDILENGDEEQYLLIQHKKTKCLTCPEKHYNNEENNNSNSENYYETDDQWYNESEQNPDENYPASKQDSVSNSNQNNNQSELINNNQNL